MLFHLARAVSPRKPRRPPRIISFVVSILGPARSIYKGEDGAKVSETGKRNNKRKLFVSLTRTHAHTRTHTQTQAGSNTKRIHLTLDKRAHTHANMDTGSSAIPDPRGGHWLVATFNFCYNSFADDSAGVLPDSHPCV